MSSVKGPGQKSPIPKSILKPPSKDLSLKKEDHSFKTIPSPKYARKTAQNIFGFDTQHYKPMSFGFSALGRQNSESSISSDSSGYSSEEEISAPKKQVRFKEDKEGNELKETREFELSQREKVYKRSKEPSLSSIEERPEPTPRGTRKVSREPSLPSIEERSEPTPKGTKKVSKEPSLSSIEERPEVNKEGLKALREELKQKEKKANFTLPPPSEQSFDFEKAAARDAGVWAGLKALREKQNAPTSQSPQAESEPKAQKEIFATRHIQRTFTTTAASKPFGIEGPTLYKRGDGKMGEIQGPPLTPPPPPPIPPKPKKA